MNATALITGAGNRIGAAIAIDLAAAGKAVVVHFNRSADDAEKLVTSIVEKGGRAALQQADLTDRSQRGDLIGNAAKHFGPLDILVNNASVFEPDSARSIDEELWDTHFCLHGEAPMFLARDFAAQLPAGTRGNIINIIDERVLRDAPGYFSYNLSKSVLWTATRTLAQSLAPDIRVNAIGPGPILPHARQSDQQFQDAISRLPLQASATPQDIAKAVRFLLDMAAMTGQMLVLDGGEHLDWRGHGGITPAL